MFLYYFMLQFLGIERTNNTMKTITKKIPIVFVIFSIGFLAWNLNENAVFAEEDSDGDGVPDMMDQCPAEKVNVNDFMDFDGCIDYTEDSDGDAIPDKYDNCADVQNPTQMDIDGNGAGDESNIPAAISS